VRHIYQNFHNKHKGQTLKNDLWVVPKSTNIPSWEINLEKIKVQSEPAHAWVEEMHPNTWIKAFLNEFNKCDMLLNSHYKVFNTICMNFLQFIPLACQIP
jgi:hypothetical protein